jgi:hypothetical protein
MTFYLLRGTRALVSLIVSIHVLLLRFTTTLADRKVAKVSKRVETAQNGVEFARQALQYAKLSVREFKDQHIAVQNDAKNTRIAADAECKFFGRSL